MPADSIHQSFERAVEDMLAMIAGLDGVRPAGSMPPHLDRLFAALKNPMAAKDPPEEIEDAIWAAWTDHVDPGAAQRMNQAISAIARRDYDRADHLLSDLVRAHPDWAEAWNKRGTLNYLRQNYAEAVIDIRRTLELEPRHFGALCGFAQICLRHGDETSALVAFRSALAINPHLYPVHAVVEELSEKLRISYH